MPRIQVTLTDQEYKALIKRQKTLQWIKGTTEERAKTVSLSHIAGTYIFRGLVEDKMLGSLNIGSVYDVHDAINGLQE